MPPDEATEEARAQTRTPVARPGRAVSGSLCSHDPAGGTEPAGPLRPHSFRGCSPATGARSLGGAPDTRESLAQALGVSKGGFYGYFGNRDALLTEMLDTWEREVSEAVIEQVESGAGDARPSWSGCSTSPRPPKGR
ncbi:hypothetical protein GCM10020000_83200 [Streptomyces olivoverticillatus]